MRPQPFESNDPPDKRTALIVKEVADSITEMLKWTADFPSAHSNGRLPILDIETWCSESPDGTLTNYSFYMKPMANPVVIPAASAISSSVKFNTYREEAKRILRNTSCHLPWTHKAELLSGLSERMKHSGYNASFRSKIISEGLRGHMKKVIGSYQNNTPFNRTGRMIREAKSRNRIDDVNWFRAGDGSTQFKTVLFVPTTPNSALAKLLRRHEEQNLQGRSSRIKIVEKAGRSIKQIMSSNYPWATRTCEDEDCFPCSTNDKKPSFSCRIPGAGYRIFCTICEQLGAPAIYFGETGQNLFTRGGQHKKEFKQKLSTNGIVIHNNQYHSEAPTMFNFRMEGTGLFCSPLERQIDESLRIKYSSTDVVMNSGSEWRMDRIPRARVARPERPQQ